MGNFRPHRRPAADGRAQTGRSGAKEIPGLGTDLPELQRARALWQSNRFEESLHEFENAARHHPQNLVALIDGSRALGARFEIARAEAMLGKLLKLAGSRPDILHLAGQSYRMIFRPNEAVECFERVLAQTRDLPDAYLELAVLYERRHRLEEAHRLIEDCLRAAPDYAEARFFRARLLRRLKQEDAADEQLRRLTTESGVHPLVQAQAWAEIAQAQDRVGDYRTAMETMLRCKAILGRYEEPSRRESEFVLEHLTRLSEEVTAEHYQKWARQAQDHPRSRTAVLTSFPRSGTTLLEQVLDAHSQLVSSDEREAFARDIFPALWLSPTTPAPTVAALDAVEPERLTTMRQRYFDFMSAALNEPIAGRMHLDKNPPMTLVLPGYLRLFPEARVLVALRDPRDVVISCFFQYLPLNPNSVCFLSLERTARRYATDMAVWRRLKERIASPWLEVKYEDTVNQLEREARRALAFLELPWEDQVLRYRERVGTKVVGSPTYEAVRQPLYTRAIGRWKHYQEFLEPWLTILQPSVDAFGY
ncbi:MAG: sulfotransferase [Verrucomicrobiales bacterium]|nr:sulfotransferase [Verrucomicrobiales bacterium]